MMTSIHGLVDTAGMKLTMEMNDMSLGTMLGMLMPAVMAMNVGNYQNANLPAVMDMNIESYWKANLGNKNYAYGRYDCTQFTNDFNDLLVKAWIKPKIVFGFLKGCGVYGRCLHCWLEINGKPFEAVTGRFIADMSKYEFRKYIWRCF